MNYPAVQSVAIVQSHWSDNTPRGTDDVQPFTTDNCTGYTDAAIQVLNAEFDTRWNAGDWNGLREDAAIKIFQNEVNGR